MSHHGNNPEETAAMHAAMKALLGEFPEGNLNQSDEGALAMLIVEETGKVVIRFPKPVQWIGFTPDQALGIAQALIDKARECGSVVPLVLRVGK